jgi:hypothetical protein
LAALMAVHAFRGIACAFAAARNVPRRWLEGSSFADDRVPSTVSGVAVGGSSAGAAVAAWRGLDDAPRATITAGGILIARSSLRSA